MKKYRFGFSLNGFIVFLLAIVPNIIWVIVPPTNNPIAGNSASIPIFDIVVHVSQFIMILLLISVIRKESKNKKYIRVYIGLASFCLAGYYALWISYYAGILSPWIYVGLAVLPSIYFISAELWLKNYVAIIPSVVFGLTHILITCSNVL
ncbi:hypothetical protein [Litchfieldia salsa]|uniref:Uncharacterized protein n=1 Tax=Litchfieldia salsa TaxID=930152 RepID=A0A1H0T328_9BACI|nr:hypothetical protein [Litchfieldia salsa]SDP48225.1 hypothetical protein SAMN05216565_103255 [Litchfieldia salsa]